MLHTSKVWGILSKCVLRWLFKWLFTHMRAMVLIQVVLVRNFFLMNFTNKRHLISTIQVNIFQVVILWKIFIVCFTNIRFYKRMCQQCFFKWNFYKNLFLHTSQAETFHWYVSGDFSLDHISLQIFQKIFLKHVVFTCMCPEILL